MDAHDSADDSAGAQEDELDAYLALPPEPNSTDILAWWKINSKKFPSVGRMAQQFLAHPAATAGVERFFSGLTQLHGDLRKNMREDTMEAVLFAAE